MSKMKSVIRTGCSLRVVPGTEDPGAVRSFMIDCLIPLLAEEFWRTRHKRMSCEKLVFAEKGTTEPVCKEDGHLADQNHV